MVVQYFTQAGSVHVRVVMENPDTVHILKEKFGLFVDFEFLTEMGSWGTDWSIPVGLRKILQRKVVENGVRKNAHPAVFRL